MDEKLLTVLHGIYEQLARQNELKERELDLIEKKYDEMVLERLNKNSPRSYTGPR
jgi:hypothetical protein